MHFELQTRATPEQVLRALTDFSERRPKIWNRTLDAKSYELRELGDTWAVARRSTAGSPFWVVERYDWSDPTMVRWTDLETSWGGLGSGSVRSAPARRRQPGGGRVEQRQGRWTSRPDHALPPAPRPGATPDRTHVLTAAP